ncbi:MAG: MaoC family dehydratase [Pseudomonadota bacterium]
MLDGPVADAPRGTVWLDELVPGMARQVSKTVHAADIEAFADISTDRNPVHLCDEYAAGSAFGGRIAHGILTAGLISAVIGEQLPGHGSVYLAQSLRFRAPVRPGDTVTADVRVTKIDVPRRRVSLDCACRVGDTVVLEGEALVLAPVRPQT